MGIQSPSFYWLGLLPMNAHCRISKNSYDCHTQLAGGEKLFVISVYQTIGAGQNLQYPIPEGLNDSLVSTNSRSPRGEKDFDAIYLDKPTNLLVSLGDDISAEDFAKYLFYTEYLQESAELSLNESRRLIKAAFRCYYTGKQHDPDQHNPYASQSVLSLCTRTIIQAVGRICRTNQKRRNIYIFADNRIAENIDPKVINGRLLNPEFTAMLEKIPEEQKATPMVAALEDKAALLSVRVNRDIQKMLKESWTESSISFCGYSVRCR